MEPFKKSWREHLKAFKPILENIFVEDYKSKVELCAALNFIANNKVENALNKIKPLNDKCVTDGDKAGLLFVYALCYEKVGYKPYALQFYQKVCDYEVDFYLPYIKVGKYALIDGAYEAANYHLQKALVCFDIDNLEQDEIMVMANIYASSANCLIKMHRLDDAKACIENSKTLVENFPLRSSIEIVIDALEGNSDKVNQHLLQLEKEDLRIYQASKNLVDNIYNKCNPTFFVIDIEAEKIKSFWQFFVDKQDTLINSLKQEDYEQFVAMIQEALQKVFTFMNDHIEVGIEDNEGSYNVIFADFYMKSLEAGYQRILSSKPVEVKTCFNFIQSH